MRYMQISPFPKQVVITDLEQIMRTRLGERGVTYPHQAIPLLSYMAHPRDAEARRSLFLTLKGWFFGSHVVPDRMLPMQRDWARVADVFNLHHDIEAGQHQRNRGGSSQSKAVALASGSIRDRGASQANLWEIWGRYKDVAHLVAAATIVAADARERAKLQPFGQFGMDLDQLQPFPVAMMLPHVVLSLALYLQEYGLAHIPHGREEPMLDPKSLWRIPSDMNVVPIPPPIRKIDRDGILVLNTRRAGNRGK
jgi:hypothetical protein